MKPPIKTGNTLVGGVGLDDAGAFFFARLEAYLLPGTFFVDFLVASLRTVGSEGLNRCGLLCLRLLTRLAPAPAASSAAGTSPTPY